MFPAYRQLVIGQAKYVNFELYCFVKTYFSPIVVRHVCLLYLAGCRQKLSSIHYFFIKVQVKRFGSCN